MVRALSVVAGLLLATPMWAQGSAKASLKAVEATLISHPLGLRGYSDDAVARFKWEGGKLVAEPARMHALSVFTAKSMKVSRGTIVLSGRRVAMVPGASFAAAGTRSEPMTIEVDLAGAELGAVLPVLVDGLFFADAAAEMAELPERMAMVFKEGASGCQCKRILEDGHWTDLSEKDRTVAAPKLVHQVEPEFSEQARKAKGAWNVVVSLYVSDKGKPEDIWLVRGAGLGLDEKAMEAVSQYFFEPARHNEKPVGTSINMEVNFQQF
jgi:TonB family protein